MSGLREGFAEIVADVPVYGDLDRAIEQADREQRRRNGAVVGLAAAAAVVALIVGVLAVSRGTDTAPPISPTPTPVTPDPTSAKSQSPGTWADTAFTASYDGIAWDVPDPLKAVRDAWFAVVVEHLDPTGDHLERQDSHAWGVQFERPSEGSIYPTYGRIGLVIDRGDLNLFDDGCGYLLAEHVGAPDEQVSCRTERFAGPGGEPARISSWGRRCGAYEGDGPAPATCGDYAVAVAVARRDGLIGYVVVDGRGTPDFNPFRPAAMAAAAADPGLTLPETAFTVPSDEAVVSVVDDHFPGYRIGDETSAPPHPGLAQAYGTVGRLGLSVRVWPAGGTPACGRSYLIECVERRVFGADDPTTVFVGAWDEEDWADCCPRNSRISSREFVYVGPRHTVVVSESLVVKADEKSLGPDLDRRLIDLALDPRLQ